MTEIVSGLRMGAKLWEASTDELPRTTSHSRWLMNEAADEIERLRAEVKAEEDTVFACMEKLKKLTAEIERLQTAGDRTERPTLSAPS